MYIPTRSCIVCKQKKPQNSMHKITKSKSGEFCVNKNGACGRSHYVCRNEECIKQCFVKKMLHKRFKTQVPDEIYSALTLL